MKKIFIVILLAAMCSTLFCRALSESGDYYAKADKYYLNAKNDSALVCLDLALAGMQDTAHYTRRTEALLLRSCVLGKLTFFEPALEDAILSYDISKKHKDNRLAALSMLAVGKVHYLMYNDSLAEDYMLRAKELAEDNRYNKELMMIDNALAQLYSVEERNDEAIALASQSLQMAKEQRDTLYIIQNLNLFASYYTNLNRWTDPIIPEYQREVKQYLDEALQLALAQNTPMLIQPIYLRYMRYYRVEKNYTEALNYANKIIEMCEPTHYSLLIQVYDHLVAIYAHLGDVKMTINSHQRFHELMRRQSDYTLHRSLQEMRVKHDVEGKEQEVKLARTHRLLLAVVAVSALLLGGMFYVMYRIRRRQNKRLHRLNATKDKLFSIISHDLKAPVVAQRMAVENMLESFDDYNTDSLLKNLNEFRRAIETQLELLQNLLNWARMQTGEMKYRPSLFDLSEMMREVMELYRLPAQNKAIALRLNSDERCMVTADRQMIHTVLRNLLNNAVKFTPEEGEINVDVTCDETGVSLRIKDNGVGISEEDVKKIVTLGESKSTNGTHGETGSGLGLIICEEMLVRNNSRLIIHSVKGKGTEVGFDI
ncbi:MAG: HAMP domain-containing sensor histidine kinase [Petrimonas sp.]|uniref:sensor histidine kinase n=1 Tax=Petrimonas sp. TaxID=2023866 RepID=UPI002B36C31D|nr:HAMP domain-containing sensor histidine kinase [Petrimonas sp.]